MSEERILSVSPVKAVYCDTSTVQTGKEVCTSVTTVPVFHARAEKHPLLDDVELRRKSKGPFRGRTRRRSKGSSTSVDKKILSSLAKKNSSDSASPPIEKRKNRDSTVFLTNAPAGESTDSVSPSLIEGTTGDSSRTSICDDDIDLRAESNGFDQKEISPTFEISDDGLTLRPLSTYRVNPLYAKRLSGVSVADLDCGERDSRNSVVDLDLGEGDVRDSVVDFPPASPTFLREIRTMSVYSNIDSTSHFNDENELERGDFEVSPGPPDGGGVWFSAVAMTWHPTWCHADYDRGGDFNVETARVMWELEADEETRRQLEVRWAHLERSLPDGEMCDERRAVLEQEATKRQEEEAAKEAKEAKKTNKKRNKFRKFDSVRQQHAARESQMMEESLLHLDLRSESCDADGDLEENTGESSADAPFPHGRRITKRRPGRSNTDQSTSDDDVFESTEDAHLIQTTTATDSVPDTHDGVMDEIARLQAELARVRSRSVSVEEQLSMSDITSPRSATSHDVTPPTTPLSSKPASKLLTPTRSAPPPPEHTSKMLTPSRSAPLPPTGGGAASMAPRVVLNTGVDMSTSVTETSDLTPSTTPVDNTEEDLLGRGSLDVSPVSFVSGRATQSRMSQYAVESVADIEQLRRGSGDCGPIRDVAESGDDEYAIMPLRTLSTTTESSRALKSALKPPPPPSEEMFPPTIWLGVVHEQQAVEIANAMWGLETEYFSSSEDSDNDDFMQLAMSAGVISREP
eukprot:m.810345 g.810345  ORF g.810345 m.810345 type:complete len:745 (+) comp23385_c0_seq1:323-2557(+)